MRSYLLSSVLLLPCLVAAAPAEHALYPRANATTSLNPTSTSGLSTATSTNVSTCSGNSASDRSTWCDYDLSTNYYEESPDTGVIREYWFELLNMTVSPDGYERVGLTVNGTIPGPAIYADWGDTVVVHVLNSLQNNGTSLHFHGIRQNWTNPQDGVGSITQCPTPPGSEITYTWKAVQYGSTWYHSHYSLQAWDGVFGPIVINGPASANYDVDLGPLMLSDWSHETSDALYTHAQIVGPPQLANGLINGTNVFGEDGWANQTGSRFEVSVTSGTSYRLRLVNTAIDTHWKFMIDNHTMTVMATDLVPIVPYTQTVLDIGMGQRYDIVVTMDEGSIASDFWIRAIPQTFCSDNYSDDNIRGILHYGTSTGTPTTTGYSYTDSCDDEDPSDLVPYLSLSVSESTWSADESVTVALNTNNLFRWYLNNSSMVAEWDDPTILQVWNNDSSWTTAENIVELDGVNEWAYLIIETEVAVPHPIHLHGHDFYVLSQGATTYEANTTLNLVNPPRRDVAMLPASGHLVIAFPTDNPGAWLCHCHIGWHTSEGFDMQFVERYSEISALIDYDDLSSNCDAWDSYTAATDLVEDDSGV